MQTGLTRAIVADSRPRVVAALLRSFRDLDLAEDLFQEACLRAAERWKADGTPRDPTAWLIRVARNAGLDRLRKDQRLSFEDVEAALEAVEPAGDHLTETVEALDRAEYKDDVLRLMFLCCHPDLKTHEQLILALRVIAGLSVDEIARAFVVTPDTMQRRISRAKERAGALAARLETPCLAERIERLTAVQTVIYLLFNEGYSPTQGDEQVRHALCDEALRLARLMLGLFPGQAETMGLLALCLFQHARSGARLDAVGKLVSLEDQDRVAWDAAMIREGHVLIEKALLHGAPGQYQVQAAIAAVHCAAKQAGDTDWAEIDRLYQALEVIAPGPVVRLNRAVAVSKVKGPAAALDLVVPLADDLRRYQPYHAVRAAFLEETGAKTEAAEALEAALACSPTRQEADYLSRKIADLRKDLAAGAASSR
jgi:RNA polymerase sigma-70 factor (ECF subfamily)